MPKESYFENKKFKAKTILTIQSANEIIEEYMDKNISITIRQLYYQLMSRKMIPHSKKSYMNIDNIMCNARLHGLTDWDVFTDRTRSLHVKNYIDNIEEVSKLAHENFSIDKWGNQKTRCEVWVEKDALIDIVKSAAFPEDVACMSCRGYMSLSSLREASKRFIGYIEKGQKVIVFHLGDHDPSGLDASRDIDKKLQLFTYGLGVKVIRIGLTIEQVRQYNLIPDYTKFGDSRSKEYISRFRKKSWELDALDPVILKEIISTSIKSIRNKSLWDKKLIQQRREQRKLIKQLKIK